MASEAGSSGKRVAAIILALMAVVPGVILGIIGTFVIPSFQQVFESFGTDLPVLTKLFINYRYFLWTPLLLIPVLWWPLRSSMARIYGYSILLTCESLLIPLIVVSMYLPIFKLGSVT